MIAPKAAPRVSEEVTIDSWKADSPRPPLECGELEEGERARDDSGVVAEEEPAQGRDRADGEEALVDAGAYRSRGGRGPACLSHGAHASTSTLKAVMKASRAAEESSEAKASIATVPR